MDARLAHLNELYSIIYPGLRYVTFVNGRSRTAIVPEFEGVLGLPISPEPIPEDFPISEPDVNSEGVKRMVKARDSADWQRECERGLDDVWRIGRARLAGLELR